MVQIYLHSVFYSISRLCAMIMKHSQAKHDAHQQSYVGRWPQEWATKPILSDTESDSDQSTEPGQVSFITTGFVLFGTHLIPIRYRRAPAQTPTSLMLVPLATEENQV